MAHRALAIIRRRLFAGLTILSLVLCLATLALWVRSYWRCDRPMRVSAEAETYDDFELQSCLGELSIVAANLTGGPARWVPGWHLLTLPSSPLQTLRFRTKPFPAQSASVLGFGFGYYARFLWCPHWFFALLFAALPVVRLRSILRTRRRDRAGLCQHCGYDLRASPQGGRCPECGTSIPSPVPA